jgi:hypothetical protein
MHDIRDVTFNIPVKIDQPDRLRNLSIVMGYLNKYFKTNIILSEMDESSKLNDLFKDISFKHVFMKTSSPYFHRTMMLNYMAKVSTTPIIVNYDCDILLTPDQIVEAVNKIRFFGEEMVFPYDGNFYDVQPQYIDLIKNNLAIETISTRTMCKNLRPEGDSVGGVIFWKKSKFMEIGMENENFISWGFEDTERYERAKKLNVKIYRGNGGLIHLHHNSSLNSANASHPFYLQNENEYKKVNQMSPDTLLNYVKTWAWAK